MKKGGIIALIVIAVAVSIMITTFSDAGRYQSLKDAKENQGTTIHVVGHVVKEKEVYYKPEVDPNMFSFYLRDTVGYEMKVIYHDTKPPEFDNAKKLALTGKAINDSTFEATDILTKCPSKYKEEEVAVNP